MATNASDLMVSSPPEPFFHKLKKIHRVDKVTSYTFEQLQTSTDGKLRGLAGDVHGLQMLALAGNTAAYGKRLLELNSRLAKDGIGFRSTRGVVYLTRHEGEKVDVEVALQVKGYSLTWYFWAEGAMDQYPQDFRDKLYNQAAICHKAVKDGCDLYYRGSNSIHVKRMHHREGESGHNHNHYRLQGDRHYMPEDVAQHMEGFRHCDIHDEFFEPGEIDEVCGLFKAYHDDWVAKTAGHPSKEEQYFNHPSQRLNTGDIIELHLFGEMQEPCRLNVDELKVDYEAARKAIEDAIRAKDSSGSEVGLSDKAQAELTQQLERVQMEYNELLTYRQIGGIRGLHSSIASSRQIEGTQNAVVRAKQYSDDSIGKEVPDVPAWAHKLREAVDSARASMLQSASAKYVPGQISDSDVALEWLALAAPEKRAEVAVLLIRDLRIPASTIPKVVGEKRGHIPLLDISNPGLDTATRSSDTNSDAGMTTQEKFAVAKKVYQEVKGAEKDPEDTLGNAKIK